MWWFIGYLFIGVLIAIIVQVVHKIYYRLYYTYAFGACDCEQYLMSSVIIPLLWPISLFVLSVVGICIFVNNKIDSVLDVILQKKDVSTQDET